MASQHLEIELQDVGGTAWWVSLLSTLSAQNGSATMRFVARPTGPEQDDWPAEVRGGTFARLRSAPDDLVPEEALCPGMDATLEDLRTRLDRAGWIEDGRGPQPWAYRYHRARDAS